MNAKLLFRAVLFLVVITISARAQISQTWDGGSGTWDLQHTADWDSGANTWHGGDDVASITSGGMITVDDTYGQVTFDSLVNSSSGTTTITGDAIEVNPFLHQNYEAPLGTDFSTTASGTNYGQEYNTIVNNGGPLVIQSKLEISDLGENQQMSVNANSSADLQLNDIDFGPYTLNPSYNTGPSPDRRLNFYAANSGTLNGKVTDSASYGYGQINFNGNGSTTAAGASVLHVTANADFSGFANGQLNDYGGGIWSIDNSSILASNTFSATSADAYTAISIVGAQTINGSVYDSSKYGGVNHDAYGVSTYGVEHIIQSTADLSTFAGNVNMDGSNVDLSAVDGGRLVVTGSLYGSTPQGLVISSGVVVLASAGGNGYNELEGQGHLLASSTVAADLKPGSTTLVTNTSGSAFGIYATSSGQDSLTNVETVNVEGGATLGGTGIVRNLVQAMAANSVFAPGDPGQASLGIVSSIGTLHLNGGLSATNGLTMNFKLNGDVYDSIDFGGTAISLDNVVTVNLLGTPDVSAANNNGTYKILTGLDLPDSSQGANLDFVFNAPAGYEVINYGTVSGGASNPGNDYVYVQLAATPEPSTYILIGLGLVALVFLRPFVVRSTIEVSELAA